MSEFKNHQPSMTIDEQIDNLREKGMIIENWDYAKSFLRMVL
jgi:abortive infection bacteriophage resistance protein